MPMLEGIPVSLIVAVIGAYGLNGLVPIFWYVDHRRMQKQREDDQTDRQKQREQDKKDLQKVLDQYKDDMRRVSHFYETNVELVKNYEKLAGELTTIVQLNTQVQTQLVEKIKNNMFCPIVRERTPEGK